MADLNGTTPPLFREALVQAGPWTMTDSWQRWLSAFWQQVQRAEGTPGPVGPQGPAGPVGPQGPAGVGLSGGLASKLAVWSGATAMTYDTLLHYDAAQHWLGIGTATPTAPLTFASVLGPKIDVYNLGAGRYGIGLQSGQLQIYADPGGHVCLGSMAADGVTFTPRFDVLPTYAYSSVPLAVMWGTVAGYDLSTNRLYAAGVSRLNGSVGIGMDPAYPLDVAGHARISYNLGTSGSIPEVGYGIATHSIHCYSPSRFESTLTVAGSIDVYAASMMTSLRLGDHVAPGATLDVNGSTLCRGSLNVLAGGSAVVSGGGYLQVTGNALYADGVHGIYLQNFNTSGTIYWATALAANPNFTNMRLGFVHVGANWAGMYVEVDGSTNNYDFRLSSGNAYIQAGGWIDAPSDRAVKREIQPIDTPLERLTKLQGSHYERTDLVALKGFPAPQTQEYGLIAQDVAEALPGAAFAHDYGTRGVLWNYYDRPILALLVESVKALAQRVLTLEGA